MTSKEEIKEKISEVGEKVEEVVEETIDKVAEKVDEKLTETKDEWAELAKADPNKARRQLRLVWGIIGLIAGIVVGYALSWFI